MASDIDVSAVRRAVDLSRIPTAELLEDARASLEDAQWCRFALRMGVETAGEGDGSDLRHRMAVNEGIIAVIRDEIDRRAAEEGAKQ